MYIIFEYARANEFAAVETFHETSLQLQKENQFISKDKKL